MLQKKKKCEANRIWFVRFYRGSGLHNIKVQSKAASTGRGTVASHSKDLAK